MTTELKNYEGKSILKFKSISYAAELIRSSSIYLADPETFNDPLDCYFIQILRDIENEKRRKIADLSELKDINVFCCCPPDQTSNHLMWSHYGANHKGIAIKYKIPQKAKNNIFLVNYNTAMHKELIAGLEIQHPSNPITSDIEDLKKSAFYKDEVWSYEKELRYIRNRSELKNNLDEDWEVEEVYLGSQFLLNEKNELLEIIEIIKTCQQLKIDIFKMDHKLGHPLTAQKNNSPHFDGNMWGELHRETMQALKKIILQSTEGQVFREIIEDITTKNIDEKMKERLTEELKGMLTGIR